MISKKIRLLSQGLQIFLESFYIITISNNICIFNFIYFHFNKSPKDVSKP